MGVELLESLAGAFACRHHSVAAAGSGVSIDSAQPGCLQLDDVTASGGGLSTRHSLVNASSWMTSRLQAAVCRLGTAWLPPAG